MNMKTLWRRSRGLNRFLAAQDEVVLDTDTYMRTTAYGRAMDEIRRGEKRHHWMPFIFPVHNSVANQPHRDQEALVYGLNAAEAQRYLRHPVLSDRLRRAVDLVCQVVRDDGVTVRQMLGLEARDFLHCMDLFASIDPEFDLVRHRLLVAMIASAKVRRSRQRGMAG